MSEPRARVNSRPSFWHKTSHQNELFLDFRGHNRVRYVGPGSDDSDAASVRTSAPVTGPFFYFEVFGVLCTCLRLHAHAHADAACRWRC